MIQHSALALSRWLFRAGSSALALPRWLFRAGSSALALPHWLFRAGSSALALPRSNPYLILFAVALLAVACPVAAIADRGLRPPVAATIAASNAPVTLSAIIARAQALNPTEDNPVLIQLGPGVYTIYDLRFTNYDLQFAVDSVAAIADRGNVAAAACLRSQDGSSTVEAASCRLRSQDGSSTRNQDGSATRGPADAGRTNVER